MGNFEEWDSKQGESVYQDGHIFFESGAYRENSPWGVAHDPPACEHERAKKVLLFQQIRSEQAQEEFASKKQALESFLAGVLRGRPSAPPSVGAAQIRELEDLAKRAREYRQALRKAKRQVAATKPKRLIEREQLVAKRRAEHEELLSRVKGIKI